MLNRQRGWIVGLIACAVLGVSFQVALAAKQDDEDSGGGGGNVRNRKQKLVETKREASKLDELQIRSLPKLGKMFDRVYGLEEELEEEDADILRDMAWRAINGTHLPERSRVNKVTNAFAAHLRAKEISGSDTYEIYKRLADALSADQNSREQVDSFRTQVSTMMNRSVISDEKQRELASELEQILRTARRNEEKIQERAAAEARRKAREEKELAAKKKLAEKRKSGGVNTRNTPRGGGRNGG